MDPSNEKVNDAAHRIEINAQEEAIRSAARRIALDVISEAVVGIQSSGKIVVFNRAAEKLFQYHRERVYGQEVEILLPPTKREVHAKQHRPKWFDRPEARPMGEGLHTTGWTSRGVEFSIIVSLSDIHNLAESDEPIVFAVIRTAEGTQI